MGLLDIDGLCAQAIQDHQVIGEHIRSLVIFGRDILCDGIGEGYGMGAPKWQLQNIPVGKEWISEGLDIFPDLILSDLELSR